MAEKQLNVFQRLSTANKIIGSQEWVKSMKNQQFATIPIDAMRAGVREACATAGLVHVGPYDIDYTREAETKGIRMFGTCSFKFVNVDDPSDEVVYTDIFGEAVDYGDKCAGKFESNLIKNAYKRVFDIGEQSKDDIDRYCTDDIVAFLEHQERVEAEKKAKKEKDRETQKREAEKKAADDPLFGRVVKERETKKEKPKEEEEANPLEVIETLIKECKENSDKDFDHVTDRTIELMNNQIMKWYSGDQNLRSIIKLFADPRAYGDDNDSWTEEQIKNCYYVCTCKGGDC